MWDWPWSMANVGQMWSVEQFGLVSQIEQVYGGQIRKKFWRGMLLPVEWVNTASLSDLRIKISSEQDSSISLDQCDFAPSSNLASQHIWQTNCLNRIHQVCFVRQMQWPVEWVNIASLSDLRITISSEQDLSISLDRRDSAPSPSLTTQHHRHSPENFKDVINKFRLKVKKKSFFSSFFFELTTKTIKIIVANFISLSCEEFRIMTTIER